MGGYHNPHHRSAGVALATGGHDGHATVITTAGTSHDGQAVAIKRATVGHDGQATTIKTSVGYALFLVFFAA